MIGYFDGNKLLGVGASMRASDGTIQKHKITKEELELIRQGITVSFVDGEITFTEGNEYNNNIITGKAQRVLEIEKEIRSLGSNETTSKFLKDANAQRILDLKTEKEDLEGELDIETEGLDETILDSLVNAIYG